MKIVLSITSFLILTFPSNAQPPDTLWTQWYGGDSPDFGYDCQPTPDGGFVIVGSTLSFDLPYEYTYLVKTDSLGDTLWTRTYHPGEWHRASVGRSVRLTSDGGYIISGYAYNWVGFANDMTLIKTDSLGQMQWNYTYGGFSNTDAAYCVQTTEDGGYIMTGYSFINSTVCTDVRVIKTDSAGTMEWSRRYGGSETDIGWSIVRHPEGGYLVAGRSSSFSSGDSECYLIRIDEIGDTLWTRTYGREEMGFCAHSIQILSDTGYIIAGNASTWDFENEIMIIRTDSGGDTLWTRMYDRMSTNESANCIQPTSDGGFIVGGYRGPYGNITKLLLVMKLDSLGDSLWTRTYGNWPQSEAHAVHQLVDGGYIAAGYISQGIDTRFEDLYLVRLGPEGTPVIPVVDAVPSGYALHQNYPNPFNSTTTITFDLPKAMRAQLHIFDITGRVVTTLADEHFPAGTHSLRFDGSEYPSGVYFARLQTESRSRTEKLILLK